MTDLATSEGTNTIVYIIIFGCGSIIAGYLIGMWVSAQPVQSFDVNGTLLNIGNQWIASGG